MFIIYAQTTCKERDACNQLMAVEAVAVAVVAVVAVGAVAVEAEAVVQVRAVRLAPTGPLPSPSRLRPTCR